MELLKRLRLPWSGGLNDRIDEHRTLIQAVETNAELSTATPEAPLLDDYRTRRILYKLWQAYVDNTVYMSGQDGGYRKLVNAYLGSGAVGNISGIFNPAERAMRAYELVFDGNFGDEIDIDPKVDKETPVNEKIIEPIRNIWKWSGINQWKNQMSTKAAALGTVGLRITLKNAVRVEDRRIMFTVEHPGRIRDLETDDRGNITQIVLEYSRVEGEFFNPDAPRERHDYIEYMSRDKFWMIRDGEWWNFKTREVVDRREDAEITNPLGIVPYVLVKLNDIGSDWGVPCFYGNERKIDHLNAIAAHILNQIKRHVTATWLLEAGGPAPEKIALGDMTIWYVQKELGMTSAASITPLVANLSLSDAISQQDKIQEEIANSMPELKATDGAFLSHQSGGTVANLRLPAESRIIAARNNMEQALIKAQKIALSLGILYNMWDLGTGMGTRKAADDAYAQGLEDHRFNKRSALPLTVDDKLTVAKTEQAFSAAKNPNTPGVKGGDNTAVPNSEEDTAPAEQALNSNATSSQGA